MCSGGIPAQVMSDSNVTAPPQELTNPKLHHATLGLMLELGACSHSARLLPTPHCVELWQDSVGGL